MGLTIVRHAFGIVFGNFREALKASMVPFGIMVAAQVILFQIAGLPLYHDPLVVQEPVTEGVSVFLGLLILPLYLFVGAWVAITWHRFILLEEYPDAVPALKARPIGAYIGRTLMLGLQMMIIVIPFIIGMIWLTIRSENGAEMMLPNTWSGFLFNFFLTLAVTYPWLRAGISLPSVAIGKPMDSTEAWGETKPARGMIFGASLLIVLLSMGVSIGFSMLFSSIPLLTYVGDFIVQWITMMIGVSVLTTIYGHVIENRSLTPN